MKKLFLKTACLFVLIFVLSSGVGQLNAQSPKITGGNHTSHIICADSTVWVWGNNYQGILGLGHMNPVTTPTQIPNFRGIVAVACNGGFVLFLKSDGTVWAAGDGRFGQMGNGTTVSANSTPVQVSISNVVGIATGTQNGYALKADGTVWAWGATNQGQLGDGQGGGLPDVLSPVQVPGLTNAIKIAAGTNQALAIRSDGTVWGWGRNDYGQAGINGAGHRVAAVIPGLSGIVDVGAGELHSTALKNDGTVWAFGINNQGQLGCGGNCSGNPVQVFGLSNVIALSTRIDQAFSLALKSDGTVWSWGGNNVGQLGNGTTNNSTAPVQVSGLSNIVAISSGTNFGYAMNNAGSIYAWGSNSSYQLGDGTNTNRTSPVLMNSFCTLINIVSNNTITATQTLCGSGVPSTLTGSTPSGCSGSYTYQWESSSNNSTWTNITGATGINYTSGSLSSTTYFRRNVNSTGCTGTVSNVVTVVILPTLGNNTLSSSQTVCSGSSPSPITGSVPTGGDGNYVYQWESSNNNSQWASLNGATQINYQPGNITVNTYFRRIVSNTVCSVAITSTSVSVSPPLGSNLSVTSNQPILINNTLQLNLLGNSTGLTVTWAGPSGFTASGTSATRNNLRYTMAGMYSANVSSPGCPTVSYTTVVAMGDIISGGVDNSFVICSDTTVWSWGGNFLGALGLNLGINTTTPARIPTLSGVVSVVSGASSVFLKSDGTVWGAGDGRFGQMGNGTTTATNSIPVQASISNVIGIGSGTGNTYAVKSDGTVWAWGLTNQGQLGDGQGGGLPTVNSPVQVPNLTGATKVVGGSGHALALKSDGTVWGWGRNDFGQAGAGAGHRPAAVISGLTGIVDIAAGEYYSSFLRNDGTVWSIGNNSQGRLGCGGNCSGSPVQVSGLSNVIAIAAHIYQNSTVALKSDGTVWTWGAGAQGQLGNGSNADQSSPVQVTGLSNIVYISSGLYHAYALSNTGVIHAWGNNGASQLGDGTNTSRNAPVVMNGFCSMFTSPANNTISTNQTLCGSGVPATLTGSTPSGCTGGYTYQWQSSSNNSTWTNVSGATAINYSPNTISSNIYFRRNVSASGCGTFSLSNTVSISVTPSLGNNSISASQTICSNSSPSSFVGSTPTGGNGSFIYQWESSSNNSQWATLVGATISNYSSGAISSPTYFRRIVSSSICTALTSTSVSVSVVSPTGIPSSVVASLATCTGFTLNWSAVSGNVDYFIDIARDSNFTNYVSGQQNRNVGNNTQVVINTLNPGQLVYFRVRSSNVCGSSANSTRGSISSIPMGDSLRVVSNSPFILNSTLQLNLLGNSTGLTVTWAGPAGFTAAGTAATRTNLRYTMQGMYSANVTSLGCPVLTFTTPVRIIDPISGGVDNSFVICGDSTVWSWGGNFLGALGLNLGINTTTPARIPTLSGVVGVVSGASSVFLKADGTVWGAGDGRFGQMGNGTTTATNSIPVQASISDVVGIGSGTGNTYAVKSDGTVWAWGLTNQGQLGDGQGGGLPTVNSPVQVPNNLTDAIKVVGGSGHALALKSDGTVWGWGRNDFGQAGAGAGHRPAAVIAGLTGIVDIAAGEYYSSFLKNDGTVWSIGNNSQGRLGCGGNCSGSPVQVSGLTNVIAIAAHIYQNSTVALKSDGTVWTWGAGAQGQLGNGSTADQSSPVQVTGLSNIVYISSGLYHAYALSNTGVIYAWGNNGASQLGDGTNTSRTSPVVMNGFCSMFITPSNNTIGATQTLCGSGVPSALTGSTPVGCSGTYSYQWETSANNNTWTSLAGATSINYTPGTISTSTYFRRYVASMGCFNSFSNVVIVNVHNTPGNNILSGSQTICTGASPAIITGAVPTGGNGVFSYQWQSSVNNSQWNAIAGATSINYGSGSISNLTYFRRVVSSSICAASTSTSVSALPLGTNLTVSSNQPVCLNARLQLSLLGNTSGLTVTWSGPSGYTGSGLTSNRDSMRLNFAGSYSASVTSSGCAPVSISNTVAVTSPVSTSDSLRILSNQPLCVNANLQLSLVGNTSRFTATWTGPAGYTATGFNATRNNVQTNQGGTYSVALVAPGCPASILTSLIPVNTPLTSITAWSNAPVGVGQILSMSVSGTSPNNTYFWSGPNGFSHAGAAPQRTFITYQDSGIYSVTVTSPGCNAVSDTFNVEIDSLQTVTVSSNSPVCEGSTLFLRSTVALYYQYSWVGPNGFTSNLPNPSIANMDTTKAGVYTLTASRPGYVNQVLTTQVSVGLSPSRFVSSSNSPICSGDTLRIGVNALPGFTFSWQGPNGFTAGNQSRVQIDSAITTNSGTYSIFANSAGCATYLNTYVVVIGQRISGSQANASNTVVCEGGSITFSVPLFSGAYYSWTGPNNFGGNSRTPVLVPVQVANAGRYYVTISTPGCPTYRDSVSISVGRSVSSVTAFTNTPICAGNNLYLSAPLVAGASYNWSGPGGYTSNRYQDTITSAQVNNAGPYVLTVTSPGCNTAVVGTRVVINSLTSPSVTTNSPVCSGGTLTFSTPQTTGATYAWSGPNGFTWSGSTPSISNATTSNSGTYILTVIYPGCGATSSTVAVQVNQDTRSLAVASSNTPVCSGQTLRISATTFSGVTYSWAGPNGFSSTGIQNDTIPNVSSAASGNYTVTLTTPGCPSFSVSTLVQVNTLPTVSINSNSPVCQGNTLNLSTGALTIGTYRWDGPNGFSSTQQLPSITNVQPNQTGRYTLTVSVPACANTIVSDTVTIGTRVTSLPISVNSPICAGQSLYLSTSQFHGVTYRWSGPNGFTSNRILDTIPSVTNTQAGAYTLQVTSPGCGTSVLTTFPVQIFSTTGLTASSNSPVCQGNTLRLSTTPVPGVTYAWSGPNGYVASSFLPSIPNVQPASAGTYTLSVAVPGCGVVSSTTSVNIGASFSGISATAQTVRCATQTLNLSALGAQPSFTYAWAGPNGFTSTSANDSVVSVTSANAGIYTLNVSSPGCGTGTWTTSPVAVLTTYNPNPTSNSPVCQAGTLYLTAASVAGATYNWSGPAGFASTLRTNSIGSVLPNRAGLYTITMNVPACGIVTDTIRVAIGSNFIGQTLGTNGPVCSGSALRISVNPVRAGQVYSWTGPNGFTSSRGVDTIPSASPSNAGVYRLVINSPGCGVTTLTTSAITVYNASAFVASANTPLCRSAVNLNLQVPVIAGVGGHQWTGPGGWSFNGRTATRTPIQLSQGGLYTVTAFMPGCGTISTTVNVTVNNCRTAQEEANTTLTPTENTGFSFHAWPNPNSGNEVTLEWKGLTTLDATITVKVYDNLGRTVMVKSVDRTSTDNSWKDSITFPQTLSKGQYVIETIAGGERAYVKMIVE